MRRDHRINRGPWSVLGFESGSQRLEKLYNFPFVFIRAGLSGWRQFQEFCSMHFIPGDTVPLSGVYRVEHRSHRLMHEATLLAHSRFPAASVAGTVSASRWFAPWWIPRYCRFGAMLFWRSTPILTPRKPRSVDRPSNSLQLSSIQTACGNGRPRKKASWDRGLCCGQSFQVCRRPRYHRIPRLPRKIRKHASR